MKNEFDFSHSRKNPYVKQLKRQITIRLDTMAVNYFKEVAAELGMPYQNLINMFLRDCAIQKRRPVIQMARGRTATSSRPLTKANKPPASPSTQIQSRDGHGAVFAWLE